MTPVPKTIFSVIPRALAINRSGAGMFSHSAVKCSPIHASLYPSLSSCIYWARSSSRVFVKFDPGGCKGIVKYPSSIYNLLKLIHSSNFTDENVSGIMF